MLGEFGDDRQARGYNTGGGADAFALDTQRQQYGQAGRREHLDTQRVSPVSRGKGPRAGR